MGIKGDCYVGDGVTYHGVSIQMSDEPSDYQSTSYFDNGMCAHLIGAIMLGIHNQEILNKGKN
jgi:hypothetical protein